MRQDASEQADAPTADDVATTEPDVTGEVDVNPSLATERLDGWLDALVFALPSVIIAAVLVGLAWLVGKLANRIVESRLSRQGREDLGQLLGGLVKWALVLTALAFGATMIFPSLSPGDLFAGLGVSSVAIGFAFKDILQNWLAGLLLLLRRPFQPGDQIEVGQFEGTVEHIETRSTMIRTYDGQRVVIPNSTVYGDEVLVKTHEDLRRSQIDIGVGFRENIADVRALLLEAMTAVEGVRRDPACEVLAWDLGPTHTELRCRWWTKAFRGDVVRTHAAVVEAIHDCLIRNNISRPIEVELHLDGRVADDVLPVAPQGRGRGRLKQAADRAIAPAVEGRGT